MPSFGPFFACTLFPFSFFRDERDMDQSWLVYGEISFEPFALTLQKIKHM